MGGGFIRRDNRDPPTSIHVPIHGHHGSTTPLLIHIPSWLYRLLILPQILQLQCLAMQPIPQISPLMTDSGYSESAFNLDNSLLTRPLLNTTESKSIVIYHDSSASSHVPHGNRRMFKPYDGMESLSVDGFGWCSYYTSKRKGFIQFQLVTRW